MGKKKTQLKKEKDKNDNIAIIIENAQKDSKSFRLYVIQTLTIIEAKIDSLAKTIKENKSNDD